MPFSNKQRFVLTANQLISVDLGPLSRMPRKGDLDVWCVSSIAASASLTVLLGTDIICDGSIINLNNPVDVIDLVNDRIASGEGEANDPITIRIQGLIGATPIVNIQTVVS